MKQVKLIDRDGNSYIFPEDFWIKDDGTSSRSETTQLDFAHGGKELSDGFLQPRTITVEGEIRADTEAAFETALRAIQRAVRKNGKLYVIDDIITRFIEVKSPSVSSEYTGDYPQEKPVSITFLAEYPFWQNDTISSDSETVTGDDTLLVDNSESDDFCLPTITISADQGVDLPSVRLRNQSDGGMFFDYNNPSFFAGAILVIDCFNGTIRLNNNDSFEFFNPARFLRLQHVVNTILYEGAAATITFTWRKTYL